MNYDVVRNGREDGYGGVLIAIKNNFIFEAITVKQNVECQFLKIQFGNCKSLIIGCIYRPPSSNIEYARELQETIRSVMKNNRSSVLWQNWERDWLMEYHPEKCQFLHISNKRNPLIHGHILEDAETSNTWAST